MHCNFIWNNIQEQRNKRPLRFFSRHCFEDGWPIILSIGRRHRKWLDRQFPLTQAANGILSGTLKRVPHSSPQHSTEHRGHLRALRQSIKAAFYHLSLESTKAQEWCVRCVYAGWGWGDLQLRLCWLHFLEFSKGQMCPFHIRDVRGHFCAVPVHSLTAHNSPLQSAPCRSQGTAFPSHFSHLQKPVRLNFHL